MDIGAFITKGKVPTKYDKNQGQRDARDAARVAASEAGQQQSVNDYSSGQSQGFGISGTLEERQKALEGLNLAKTGYGQDIFQTGRDISGVRERLKERSAMADPISEAIRGQKAGAMASANRNLAAQGIKGGAAAGAVANVGRAADADIAASLYGQQRQSIADERSLASNTLSGTVGLMQGGKAEGTEAPDAPKASSWTDSVICTELHRQGLMPNDIYLIDSLYGKLLEVDSPETITGYHFLARPVVKLMQISPIATKIISPFALKWAEYIAGDFSVTGAFLFHVGQPMCTILGKIINSGAKYVSIRSN